MRDLSSGRHRLLTAGAHGYTVESADRLDELCDDALPAAALMLGHDASEMLATADDLLAAEPISAIPRQILWHPGRQLVIRYAVRTAATPDAIEEVVAATGDAIPKKLRNGDPAQVLAWRRDDDPWLPGLRSALSPPTVAAMLESLGAAPAPIRLQLRTYRPTRRAVIQVSHPAASMYLKVVPPRSAARLDAMHRAFKSPIRAPRSMGLSKDLGIAVLEGLPGRTLREALADPLAEVPSPETLLALLDALPTLPAAAVVGGPTVAVQRHIGLLERIAPEARGVLGQLRDACSGPAGEEASVAVHGDFYESQVLVEHGAVTGLIDIDRMGIGRRVDDIGTLAGHLASFAMSAPVPARVRAYGTGLVTAADRLVDPIELRRVTAATLIAMATGPFRVQSKDWPDATRRRIAAAAEWVVSARRSREKSLIGTS